MNEEQENEAQEPDNVIDMQGYRQSRKRSRGARRGDMHRADDGSVHVYIDLENGHLDYGLAAVTQENALWLLEPWLELGSDLLKIYMD
ncbi:hypothetical protein [Trinickia mobilis]|uniref:hypothetical protein n=1 Tax=Trinickia mobilis TaxID=2816356 RepID=UPI001A8F3710|nr:hypothetical protein [Trinickia mobilis]